MNEELKNRLLATGLRPGIIAKAVSDLGGTASREDIADGLTGFPLSLTDSDLNILQALIAGRLKEVDGKWHRRTVQEMDLPPRHLNDADLHAVITRKYTTGEVKAAAMDALALSLSFEDMRALDRYMEATGANKLSIMSDDLQFVVVAMAHDWIGQMGSGAWRFTPFTSLHARGGMVRPEPAKGNPDAGKNSVEAVDPKTGQIVNKHGMYDLTAYDRKLSDPVPGQTEPGMVRPAKSRKGLISAFGG